MTGILLTPALAWVVGRVVGGVWVSLGVFGLLEAGLLFSLRGRRRALLALLPADGSRPVPARGGAWSAFKPWADEEAAACGERWRREADAATARLVSAQLQLLSLHDVIRHLTSLAGKEQILDALLEHCQRRFGARAASCFLPSGPGRLVSRTLSARSGELLLTEAEHAVDAGCCQDLVTGKAGSLLIADQRLHPLLSEGALPDQARPGEGYLAVALPLAQGATGTGALVLWGAVRPGELDDGARAALEALGRAAGAVLANAALYERLSAEHDLRDGILNSLGAGVVAFDAAGRPLYHNRAARDMLALSPERFAALTPATLCPELGHPQSPLGQVAAGTRNLATAEVALPRPGEPALSVRLTAAALPAGPTERGGLLCVLDDLTALRAMQDQIRQLDKLAAIGRFTSSLAHEIRNPLAGIAAGIDYLKRNGGLGREHAEYIRIISLEIERLDRIIHNLFAVARPGYLMLSKGTLAPILERVLAGLAPAADAKGVAFAVEAPGGWREIECDGDRVQQVLLNLAKNALEAETRGGTVRIRAGDARAHPAGPGREEGQVVVFENGGESIDPSERERLFEPFFSRKQNGTGLGLYVSYNIVKQHGGTLEAESDPAGVTRFRLFLPCKPPLSSEAP